MDDETNTVREINKLSTIVISVIKEIKIKITHEKTVLAFRFRKDKKSRKNVYDIICNTSRAVYNDDRKMTDINLSKGKLDGNALNENVMIRATFVSQIRINM